MRLKIIIATSGNRTRAARAAGEHSTTEPTLHIEITVDQNDVYSSPVFSYFHPV